MCTQTQYLTINEEIYTTPLFLLKRLPGGGKDAHPMHNSADKHTLSKDRLLRRLDWETAALPREQQNLVAAYAQGLAAGLSLPRLPGKAFNKALPAGNCCETKESR